jgi:bacillolysin
MKNKLFLLSTLLMLKCVSVFAQKEKLFWNEDMRKIAEPTSTAEWIRIKTEVSLNATTFFSTQKKALQLNDEDDMRLYKPEQDNIGFTHYRFQQYYKGYKVIGGEFILHTKAGKLLSANGKIIRNIESNTNIIISKENALISGLKNLPAEKYAWQIPELENAYKEILHDKNASYKPNPELVWVSTDVNFETKWELSYMFDIYPSSLDAKRIFINANTGSLIKILQLRHDCTQAFVTTNFNGQQGFYTRLIPASNPASYNLWNDCQPAFIRTRQWNVVLANSTDYSVLATDSWQSNASAVSSHWALERTLAYFLNIHGRTGWNGAAAGVNIYQNALFCYTNGCTPNSSNNASFLSGTLKIGNNGTTSALDDWNSLDILAHEFAHGVTESSANLDYLKESGALNESFSDIFGASVYSWFNTANINIWKVGFDRKTTGGFSLYIRNMSNPNDKNDPDTYLGTNWVSTTTATDVGGDNWGVHTNSGVQNFMYYLLVTGGTGTNDNGTSYNVSGIGFVKARAIAYRALTNYLSSSSTYLDARNAWVHAAVDLYGDCSFEAIQTGKAWYAVGLNVPSPTFGGNICGTYGTTTTSLSALGQINIAPNCIVNVLTTGNTLQVTSATRVLISPSAGNKFFALNGSRFVANNNNSDCIFASY